MIARYAQARSGKEDWLLLMLYNCQSGKFPQLRLKKKIVTGKQARQIQVSGPRMGYVQVRQKR